MCGCVLCGTCCMLAGCRDRLVCLICGGAVCGFSTCLFLGRVWGAFFAAQTRCLGVGVPSFASNLVCVWGALLVPQTWGVCVWGASCAPNLVCVRGASFVCHSWCHGKGRAPLASNLVSVGGAFALTHIRAHENVLKILNTHVVPNTNRSDWNTVEYT